jgi:hypothetical protein
MLVNFNGFSLLKRVYEDAIDATLRPMMNDKVQPTTKRCNSNDLNQMKMKPYISYLGMNTFKQTRKRPMGRIKIEA